LELGIDIGELDAAVLTGFPGSIASLWQQAGRAGRRSGEAAALLIASSSPLDQYIANHPRYIFGNSPEYALINPDNLRLMVKHIACAAFELPFQPGDSYGALENIDDLLQAMTEMQLLHHTGRQFHYLGDGEVPANKVSLRTSGNDTVVIQLTMSNEHLTNRTSTTVIGEIDLESAPLMVYEGAIYMHQAQTYLVDELDWDGRIAHVRPVDVDYYTRSSIGSDIRELMPAEEDEAGDIYRAHGDVLVVTQATGYRKIKQYTHETLGYGEIDLPEIELDTQGYWLIFSEALTEKLYEQGILLRPNDYGPNWQHQRQKALSRDNYTCRTCGAVKGDTVLHIHHIRPFREYGYVRGQNEHYKEANKLDNLITLCPSCHRRAEQGQQARSAMGGLAYVWRNLAPLYLMCDPSDIQVSAETQNPLTQAPTIVIYERVPAGIGFSQRLFELHEELVTAALELVTDCRCKEGCPACVGPPGEIGPDTKEVTRQLLQILNQQKATTAARRE
ncbi:MAG: DUF1998 domain-containing protein, partial [Anaerolineales bacterium]|nr:DUF1998 domain-containing protein [Anaerolineales bacterium]